jgi:hypothetical protein
MTEGERQRRQLAFSAMGSVLVLLLIVVTCSVYLWKKASTSEGQMSKQPAADTIEEVTICQLAADPAKYNQKLVKVTAFLSHGFEDSSIYDPTCESRFGVWYEYGGKNSTGTMYCCGVTSARDRPEQITVENIPIPLLVDQNFQKLDQMLHQPADTIVHGTVIGRFFSGEKSTAANGKDRWEGYGHMGCCSLFMIQQVVQVDPRDRSNLDYRASPDQPDLEKFGCGNYQILRDIDSFKTLVDSQHAADEGVNSWAFDDPLRVAVELLAKLTSKEASSVSGVRLKRETQGRMVYEWKPNRNKTTYMVVISRPYELSFHAKTDRVVWVPIAAYRVCE